MCLFLCVSLCVCLWNVPLSVCYFVCILMNVFHSLCLFVSMLVNVSLSVSLFVCVWMCLFLCVSLWTGLFLCVSLFVRLWTCLFLCVSLSVSANTQGKQFIGCSAAGVWPQQSQGNAPSDQLQWYRWTTVITPIHPSSLHLLHPRFVISNLPSMCILYLALSVSPWLSLHL